MTHIRSLLLAASCVGLLVACGDRVDETATPQQPDANPAATIPTPANEAAAPDFVEKAAQSDMFEIETSKIAVTKARNPDVKTFAQMMVDGHTKTTADLKAAIASSGQALTPPTALTEDRISDVNELRNTAAGDFDMRYMNEQVDAHQASLDLMQRYANDGDVPALKSFAAATAAIVQEHYDRARALRDRLRGDNNNNDAGNTAAKK